MTHAQTRFIACIRDLPLSMLELVRSDSAAHVLHAAIDIELERRAG